MISVKVIPPAVAENTSNNRVLAATGILNPEVKPSLVVPIFKLPDSAGKRVTPAPGIAVKTSFGVGDEYTCAVIVAVLPGRSKAADVLKYAEMSVIVPALGIENAVLSRPPEPAILKVLPTIVRADEEVPNPNAETVATRPCALVVIVIGVPDANGMIALLPAEPVGPVAPVGPITGSHGRYTTLQLLPHSL